MSSQSKVGILTFLFVNYLFFTEIEGFKNCHRYTSFGYGYRDFFEYKGGNFSPNQVFYLEFYVKTVSDAHIMLKSDAAEEDGYEIVIGGGSNTFSQIRLISKENKKTMMSQKTDNLLSAVNYVAFYIAIDKIGIISVGKKDDDDVFLNWRLELPFPIRYISFGSWTNVKADWRFGCEDTQNTEFVEEVPNLTPLQRLKNDLFYSYDANVVPSGNASKFKVRAAFQIHTIQLSEKRGQLTLYGSADLKWQNNKIKWKPDDYNGIQAIYVPPFTIWTPNLRVLNTIALANVPLFDLKAAGVTVRYDGSHFWRPPFVSESSCVVDIKNWPYDIHNCSVYIGFWMEPSNLVLTLTEDDYETLIDAKTSTEWELLELVPSNGDLNLNYYGVLYVVLRRMYGPHTLLLTVPYIAAAVMSLASFWVWPNGSNKIFLSCGGLFIFLSVLFYIGQEVPAMTENVPRIINIYSWSTVIVCFPIMLIVLLKIILNCVRVPECMSKLLNSTLLDRLFCLPELPQNLTQYSDLNFEGSTSSKDNTNGVRLVTVIERIFFFLYLITLIIPLVIF